MSGITLIQVRCSLVRDFQYRKIPKISPSMYKPLKIITQKNPPLNRPSEYKPPGGLYLEFALEYKVKQDAMERTLRRRGCGTD